MSSIDDLCNRIEAIERATRRVSWVPPELRDALTAARASVRTARARSLQSASVQRPLFDDTPKDPIVRVPYSDTGHSLEAAGGVAKSGTAKKWRRWCLTHLGREANGATCDELVSIADRLTGRSMHSNISARLNGLVGDGLAFVEGSRRTRSGRRAGVHRLTNKGRDELAKGESRVTSAR